MNPDLAKFDFKFPSLDRIVDELRHDEEASIGKGARSARLDLAQLPADEFRAIPIDQVMRSPFTLAHFSLRRFDAPGKCLHGFGDKVMKRWETALAAHGFTWDRCYPIIFISGKGSTTNYHMDFSHVFAWQVYGVKRFCGLVNPDQWANRDARVNYKPANFPRPTAIREEDSLCYDMRPGDQLWNVLLTPHWVEAGDEPAMSINISHGGLRYHGNLSPNEEELEQYRLTNPDAAPAKWEKKY
jgi:hypothetical protein